ncbi:E3 ubiquitin-protein ligase LRSAM1 isoform X2 [Pseudomyrmex gracilis]|uniref:E3 ubiquitin-protein ligase LRSAM1 isoform X2 n=1 Tax=Pseudomyrmex gracilis TaxID=219809 RepID=UPI000994A1F2|nr:E3 ubiquitin-protein ligase LRSAM1 isoform X2 [Pseudomyrmex gracilis]
MGNSGLKQHYETAKKTGTLKLSQRKLDEFPRNLSALAPLLRTLDLSENKFTALPNEIGEFTQLKQLNVSHNRLSGLPGTLGALVKLEGKSVQQSHLGLPAGVLRPSPSGRSGSVQKSADDRAGRGRRSQRDRAQSESESDRDHLRETGRMSATENAATGGELLAAELGASENSQGLQRLDARARRESLRDEAVRESGRLRRLHGALHGRQEEDVLIKVVRSRVSRTYRKSNCFDSRRV